MPGMEPLFLLSSGWLVQLEDNKNKGSIPWTYIEMPGKESLPVINSRKINNKSRALADF